MEIKAYVGDVVIICWIIKVLEEALEKLDNRSQEVGLIVNQVKAKHIRISTNTKNQSKQIERGT